MNQTVKVWKSKNGRWEIYRNGKSLAVAKTDNGRLDWSIRYADGQIAWDGHYRIPKYVLEKVKKLYAEMNHPKITYRVVDHFDVWGNAKDGWEVNDSREIGTISLPEDHTNADIIRALKEIGYLKKTCRVNQFHFIDMVDAVSIESKSEGYRPLCTLYVTEDPA